MTRAIFDPRVWLPLAIAGVWFGLRATPTPPPTPLGEVRAITLPAMHGLPPASKAQHLDLDPERSSVRFLVTGLAQELLVACPGVKGTLDLEPNGNGELELVLDLATLQPLHGAASGNDRGIDVAHVLGVYRGSTIVYRARLAATTTSDLPGVSQRTFLGTLRLGAQVLAQPMQLWQCSLPGQPLRLQGHGTVAADQYGLPTRRWLALFPEDHAVTLGLDLAWRRRAS